MRSKFHGLTFKSVALTATMLLVAGAASAQTVTSVSLTAQRMSATMPDGTTVPMWGYCTNQVATDPSLNGAKLLNANVCSTTTLGVQTANRKWLPGPTIVVPAGNQLSIQLTNNIAQGTATSLVILGQIGGSAGSPTRDAAPIAHAPVTATTWPANGAAGTPFVPPTQTIRARAFAQEAAFGSFVSYTWNTNITPAGQATYLKPGTYLYETGTHPSLQAPMGLYGVLIVTTAPTVTGTTITASGQAFPGAYVGGPPSVAALANVPYDADATLLFSEIDAVQNAAVDAAAVANTPETVRWNDPQCLQSQQAAPVGYQVPCYPAAVNYAATYFLVNGAPYDVTNPAGSSVATAVPTANGNLLVRLVNAGLKVHVPTFVGSTLELIAEDGNVAPGLPQRLSEVNMPAGKTFDAILVGNGAVPTAYAEGSIIPFFDHALSLANGNKGKGGLEGYVVVTNTTLSGTATTASLNTAIGAKASAAIAAKANPDNFTLSPNATSFTGNVLTNDIAVTQAGIGLLPVGGFVAPTTLVLTYGSVTMTPDGNFTWSVAAAGIPPAAETFTYCGLPAPGTCALVTLKFAAKGTAPVAVARVYDNSPTTAYPSVVSTVITVPRGAGLLAGATDPNNYPLTAAFPATATPPTWVTLNPDGSFVATPCRTAFPAQCSFGFVVVNSQGTASATVNASILFPAGSGVAVNVVDATSGAAPPVLADYSWIIEEDQTWHNANPGVTPPFVAGSTPPPSLATSFHRAHSPIIAAGCTGPLSCRDAQAFGGVAASPTPRASPSDVELDPTKYYYVSVLPGDAANPVVSAGSGNPLLDPTCGAAAGAPTSCGHTMGGASIAPLKPGSIGYAGAPITVKVEPNPLPPAQLSIYIFDDNAPTNGDPEPNEHGLGGFNIVIFDVAGRSGDPVGQITYDAFNYPLTNALLGTPGCPNDYSPTPSSAPATIIDPVTNLPVPNPSYAGKDLTGVIITCPNDPLDAAHPRPQYALQGMALVKNLMPGRFDVIAHPGAAREGAGEIWHQVTTLEGTPGQDAFSKAGEPAYFQEFGPPGFHTVIGFVNPAEITRQNFIATHPETNDTGPEGDPTDLVGTGPPVPVTFVSGRVTSLHMSRPVMEVSFDTASNAVNPQTTCFVAINMSGGTGLSIGFTVCDPNGNFKFLNVPVGSYELVVWDKWLDQIITRKSFQIRGTVANPMQPVSGAALGDIPVFTWFTHLRTSMFVDENNDGIRQPTEPGIGGVPVRVRFRDGSISNTLLTDASGNAVFYELFPLFNWYVVESDRTRFAGSGVNVTVDAGGVPDCVKYTASSGNPLNPSGDSTTLTGNAPSGQPCALTGGVLNSQYVWTNPMTNTPYGGVPAGTSTNTNRIDPGSTLTEGVQGFIGQTSSIDWGKRPLKDRETGGVQGMVVYVSTRGFDDPSLEVQFMWEPGIPRVKMNLYQEIQNADGTTGLKLVDSTTTTSWDDFANGTHAVGATQVPNMQCPGQDPNNLYLKYTLGTANQFKCYDGFQAWNQVQPAVYDGAYSFPTANCAAGFCRPNPASTAAKPLPPVLPPGKYVVEAVLPPGYEITKEEDKNILIGDVWVAPVAQQFGALSNIFIMPDQASVASAYNPSNANNSTQKLGFVGAKVAYPTCVGSQRTVPDFLSLFPNSGQVAPFAGATKALCDRKEVAVNFGGTATANFHMFSDTPRASHFTGLILDDASSEMNKAAPDFGEKFAVQHAPVSLRDFNGVEISRLYSDQWGTYNGVVFSSWQVNVPNPAGYSPNMLVTCMNDPGPIPDPTGKLDPATGQVALITDPLYNPSFSNFCYTNPFMPGLTVYLDTPVLPLAAHADGYSPPDCALPDATPAIFRVDGDKVGGKSGPWVAATGAAHPLTITARGDVEVPNPAYVGPTGTTAPFNQRKITRHYGFGTTPGQVRLGPAGTLLNVSSWTDLSITASIPDGTAGGELQITTAAGRSSVDTVTVTIEPTTPVFVSPVFQTANPTGLDPQGIPHPIQDAIDAAAPGALIIVDAGIYPELVIMWKPVRLQGVGAPATTINAAKYPTQKLEAWRPRINQLFGVDSYPGTNAGTTLGTATAHPQVDPLPTQTVTGGVVLIEPTVLATEEGAGITVLAKNLPQSECTAPTAASTTLSSYWLPTASSNGTVTAVAETPSTSAMGDSNFWCHQSRIDGLSITGSDAGGGIYVNGWAHGITISNNEIFGNAGAFNGGVRVGIPFEEATLPPATGYGYNKYVHVHHNMIVKNGTVEGNQGIVGTANATGTGAGLSICTGTDQFSVSRNFICGNYGSGNGGGIGLLGVNMDGVVSHNSVLYNQSYQQTASVHGGGISVEGDLNQFATGNGTGNLTIDSNLIVGNMAEVGHGGGIQLAHVNGNDVGSNPLDPSKWYRVTVTNNVITNNVAGWSGGGIYLVDTLNSAIYDNTIANNDSIGMAGSLFGSAPNETGTGLTYVGPSTAYPSPAGISLDQTSIALLALLPVANRPTYQFSHPIVFNDIIWHNRSFYVDFHTGVSQVCSSNRVADATTHAACIELPAQTTVGQCTGTPAYWDIGLVGDATVAPIDPAARPNIVTSYSAAPGFVAGYCNGSRNDPALQFQANPTPPAPAKLAVGITIDEGGNFAHLQFGPLWQAGDYHLTNAGSAFNTGRPNLSGVTASAIDLDSRARPAIGRNPNPQNFSGYDVGALQYSPVGAGVGAVLVSPAALAFATGSVTSQDVTVRNTGTTTVNFVAANAVTLASNPGGAFTQNNTCGASLASGATCTITVTFAVPAAAATATVTVAFAGLPSQTVSVTGAGTLYTVNPTTWTYAQVSNPRPAGTLGLTHNFIVTAGAAAMPFSAMTLGGTNPFEFRIMTNSCPVAPALLAANASCTVGVAFAPTQKGTMNATLNVAPANGAAPTGVTLIGTATTGLAGSYFLSAPVPTPRTAAFGNVQVGTAPAHTVTLTLQNNRPASTTLSRSSFIVGGPGASQYTLTSPPVGGCPATIAVGTASCLLTVTFTPTGGDAIATVFGPAAAQNVSLTGTGLVPVFALAPSPVVVGSLGIGVTSPPVAVTLTNSGPGALSGITTLIGGTNAAEFTVAPLTCGTTLAVGASCTFNVTFTQQVAGISRATLTVNVDPTLGATPAAVALISAPPSASLTGATGAFLNQTIGAVPAAQQTFTYTNTGVVPISIAPGTGAVTGITVTGTNASDFVATTTCTTAPLAPGASCPITVTFNPTIVGAEGPATLTVTDTASGAPPQTATLTGIGTNAKATLVGIGAFGNQSVGVASTVHAFTYTNAGTTPITIATGGIALTGVNATDFGQTNNCPVAPATLGAGLNCTINVIYTPSAQGAESATLFVTNTDGGAPTQTASLTGTGVLISASLTGTGAFGNGQVGVPSVASTFTYVNTGTVAITIAPAGIAVTGPNLGDFAIGANTCPTTPMAPAASCTFTVTFTAAALGDRVATLTVTDTAGGAAPQTANLTGTGVAATASLTGTAAFGTFQTGVASPVHGFTYTNTGVGPITIAANGIGVTGANSGDFVVQPTGNCPTTAMAAGASCTINVIFTPSVLGAEAGTLTVTDTAGGAAPQTVNMTGTGATGTASLTGTGAFGNQQIGIASSVHPFVYTNTGAGPITIAPNGIGVTGAYNLDFGQTNNCPTTPLAAGASCTINVVFTPSTVLGETATLTVTDTALGAAPQSVLMTGTGQPPTASLTGPVAYGTQQTGIAATNAFTYTNTGYGPITIAPSGITLSGGNAADFTQTNNCPTTSMAAGTSCTINVTFTPSAVGSRSTTLAVADTAGGAPTQSVPLTGSGQAPSATLTPPSLLTLAASNGNSGVPLSTTLLNTGIGPITVGTPVRQAAVPPVGLFTTFAVTGNTCPPVLLSGASCQITVTYTSWDGEPDTGQDSAQFAIGGTVPLLLQVHGHVDPNL